MIDDKMKAAFARRFPVVDEAEFWALEGVEWTLEYLRSQQEPMMLAGPDEICETRIPFCP